MSKKTIKGDMFESYIVTAKNSTFTLDKNALVHYGGKIDLSDLMSGGAGDDDPTLSLLFGYGIVEDSVSKPGIKGNTYNINGEVVGLFGAVTTFGDNTKINIGKTAEVTAGLGIGITDIMALTGGDFSSLTIGSVYAAGDKTRIDIARGGEVGGLLGVVTTGRGASIVNAGEIQTGLLGMMAGSVAIPPLAGGAVAAAPGGGAASKMVNNGSISSALGMFGVGTSLALENGKNGDIVAGVIGMGVLSVDGMKATITNAGTVRVTISLELPEEMEGLLPISSAAILGGSGVEVVKNTGKLLGHVFLGDGNDTMTSVKGEIRGDVNLGGGNDTMNYAGGKITGKIYGGEGNDTLVVSKANQVLVEFANQGNDTVRSDFTYKLAANVERLLLTGSKDVNGTGNGGDNVLKGNSGDNVLKGGGGADTFFFGTKGGRDTIADFDKAENDVLDLSGWKGMTETLFEANAKEKGDDVVIKHGKDVLVIADHSLDDLADANIVFAL